MTIKEIEERSGMTRANIRFYESEGLLSPARRENGYRDYSEKDLEILERIRLLRTLHISLEEIKALHTGEQELTATLEHHLKELEQQQEDLEQSRKVCLAMKQDGVRYETLNAQPYLAALEQPARQEKSQTPPELVSDRVPRVQAPWRRFFARSLDLAIYSMLWDLFLILAVRISLDSFSAWGTMVSSLLGLVSMLVLEPVLLSFFGTTAGKWLLGLRVLHYEERRLTRAEARSRTFGVWFWGMGLGVVPIFNLVRYWKSYKACMDGDTLPWESDSVLYLKDEKRWRIAAWVGVRAAVFGGLFLALAAAGQAKYRGDITVSQFCENYNRLAAYHNMEGGRSLDKEGNWIKEPVAENVVVIAVGNSVAEPEFTFTEEEGIMTGMSFTIFLENSELWVNGCQEEMMLSVLSFVGAQKKGIFLDGGTDAIVTSISENPFEGFQFTANGVIVTCEVEYSGYMNSGDLGVLIPEEGKEQSNSFYLHFEMRKE